MSSTTQYVVRGKTAHFLALDEDGRAHAGHGLESATRFDTVTEAARAMASMTSGAGVSLAAPHIGWSIYRLETSTHLEEV